MAFSKGSGSFDTLPSSFTRTHSFAQYDNVPLKKQRTFVKHNPDLSNKFDSAREMFDTDGISMLRTVQRPLATTQQRTTLSTREQLLLRMQEKPKKKAQSRKRDRKDSSTRNDNILKISYDEGEVEDEDEDEIINTDQDDDENYDWDVDQEDVRSEEEEPNSEDEEIIDDRDSDDITTDSDYSEEEEAGTSDFSECSDDEGEAEEESSDESLIELSTSDDEVDIELSKSDHDEEIVVMAETENILKALPAFKAKSYMEPILICTDKHIHYMIIAMFWSVLYPFSPEGVISLNEAIPIAFQQVRAQKSKLNKDITIDACRLWLVNQGKMRQNLLENYTCPPLATWIGHLKKTDEVDDTPRIVYLPRKTQYCFMTGVPCRRGVQLVNVKTQTAIDTLWFDAANVTLNRWVLWVVRFLFLPATIRQLISEIIETEGHLTEADLLVAQEKIQYISENMQKVLYQEGVVSSKTGMLDMKYTRNYALKSTKPKDTPTNK